MIFLFPRWDMLVPWGVRNCFNQTSLSWRYDYPPGAWVFVDVMIWKGASQVMGAGFGSFCGQTGWPCSKHESQSQNCWEAFEIGTWYSISIWIYWVGLWTTLTKEWKTILFCALPHPSYKGNCSKHGSQRQNCWLLQQQSFRIIESVLLAVSIPLQGILLMLQWHCIPIFLVSPATCHPVQCRVKGCWLRDSLSLQMFEADLSECTPVKPFWYLVDIYSTIYIINCFNQTSLSWRYDYLPGAWIFVDVMICKRASQVMGAGFGSFCGQTGWPCSMHESQSQNCWEAFEIGTWYSISIWIYRVGLCNPFCIIKWVAATKWVCTLPLWVSTKWLHAPRAVLMLHAIGTDLQPIVWKRHLYHQNLWKTTPTGKTACATNIPVCRSL